MSAGETRSCFGVYADSPMSVNDNRLPERCVSKVNFLSLAVPMDNHKNTEINRLFRFLPKVDRLLKTAAAAEFNQRFGAQKTTETARAAIESVRENLRENDFAESSSEELTGVLLERAETYLQQTFEIQQRACFQRVINATGVIVHTNLGRAPLAEAAKKAIIEIAAGYCTLEYDVETGARGRRGRNAEELLCELTNAEAALIVNNCAAATILILAALAQGGEAIVSRGELVEIGGDFRIPDVMAQAGARLVEVGTTNRTKLSDFERAISENTKLVVRVHPSNFRIVGFTEMPDLKELADAAHNQNVLLYEDAGSGALVDLSEFGLDEPVISQSIKAGADVVSFSGDKLLGAAQSGLIVGKREVIEKLRKHPLYRALRVDKIVYAALGATLEIFAQAKQFEQIPVLQMLAQTKPEIEQRAKEFVARTEQFVIRNLKFVIADGTSAPGGGSAPLAKLETVLIRLRHNRLPADELARRLRFSVVPIAARVADDQVLLDLRTVTAAEANEILHALIKIDAEDFSDK